MKLHRRKKIPPHGNAIVYISFTKKGKSRQKSQGQSESNLITGQSTKMAACDWMINNKRSSQWLVDDSCQRLQRFSRIMSTRIVTGVLQWPYIWPWEWLKWPWEWLKWPLKCYKWPNYWFISQENKCVTNRQTNRWTDIVTHSDYMTGWMTDGLTDGLTDCLGNDWPNDHWMDLLIHWLIDD